MLTKSVRQNDLLELSQSPQSVDIVILNKLVISHKSPCNLLLNLLLLRFITQSLADEYIAGNEK